MAPPAGGRGEGGGGRGEGRSERGRGFAVTIETFCCQAALTLFSLAGSDVSLLLPPLRRAQARLTPDFFSGGSMNLLLVMDRDLFTNDQPLADTHRQRAAALAACQPAYGASAERRPQESECNDGDLMEETLMKTLMKTLRMECRGIRSTSETLDIPPLNQRS
ncbi:hypothetical protein EYF80_046111 [Liparis tanakae]|uniref:Uncharacterized protein n=1 Tax=Liparis tanakae TaxID=230148 RepID=A0A4Z2FSK3_9TELE|nr:hypothetical protein EYF80_046111 [Liparis tanakae]